MPPRGPGQSPQLLTEVVRELEALDIRYAVIGALAVSFHGVVRSSLDADALISVAHRSQLADSLIPRLHERGWAVEHRRGAPDDPIESVVTVTDEYGNCVDLLTGIRGMRPGTFSRTIAAPVLGTTLEVIGAEDLIAMKLYAGSPRDLEDARGVLEVSAGSLDRALLEELATGYGAEVSRKLKQLSGPNSAG